MRSCLNKFGIAFNDMQFVNLGQAQIISAITSNNGDIAGVWAPNNYTLEEKADAKTLCTGADAGAIIPGALVVRADYAKEHPKDVAAYPCGVSARLGLGQGQPGGSARHAEELLRRGGRGYVRPRRMDKEFALRPVFLLDEQLAILDRGKGASKSTAGSPTSANSWSDVGTFPGSPIRRSFITDDYMKMVAADPKLKAFATEFDKK